MERGHAVAAWITDDERGRGWYAYFLDPNNLFKRSETVGPFSTADEAIMAIREGE